MQNNVIEVSVRSLPNDLDPKSLFLYPHFLVSQGLFQNLIRLSESGAIVGDIADSWSIDGATYSFVLKPTKFQDGTEMSADDVVFSLARHFWPGHAPGRGYLSKIILGADDVAEGAVPKGIVAKSKNEVQITLAHPYPPFLYVLAMPSFGVISKTRYLESKSLVGSGPMRQVLRNGSQLTLSRNEYFSEDKHRPKEIRVTALPRDEDVRDMLMNEKIDVALIGLSNASDINTPPNGYTETMTDTLSVVHIALNTKHPLLTEKEFRRDLSRLIWTYSSTAKISMRGFEFNPFYFPKGLMPPKYYEKSLMTLSPKEFSANWRLKTKNRILKLHTSPSYFSPEYLNGLKSFLSEAQITLEVVFIPNNGFMKVAMAGDYDLLALNYIANFPDPDGLLDPLLGRSGWQWGVFDAEPLRLKIDKVRSISAPKERLEQYAEIMHDFEENSFLIPLFRTHIRIIHNKRIHMPATNLRYEGELWNMMWIK